MDRIVISGIQFYGYTGVSEEERRLGQRFSVDVEIGYDLKPAGRSDRLADTINYSQVYKLVRSIGKGESFQLLEALAERMAQAILAAFPAEEVKVRVRKLSPPIAGILDWVGVEIIRRKD